MSLYRVMIGSYGVQRGAVLPHRLICLGVPWISYISKSRAIFLRGRRIVPCAPDDAALHITACRPRAFNEPGRLESAVKSQRRYEEKKAAFPGGPEAFLHAERLSQQVKRTVK